MCIPVAEVASGQNLYHAHKAPGVAAGESGAREPGKRIPDSRKGNARASVAEAWILFCPPRGSRGNLSPRRLARNRVLRVAGAFWCGGTFCGGTGHEKRAYGHEWLMGGFGRAMRISRLGGRAATHRSHDESASSGLTSCTV
jgi:hypothetical protein